MTAAWPRSIDPSVSALVVFALTYAVLGFGSLPPLRIDRTGAALIGATAMIGLGVLAPHEALAAIDFHTLALLFGMMVVVAHLRFAGFFAWLDARLLGWTRTPAHAVMLTLWLSGGVSALFVNDTACLLLTPLGIETATRMQASPVPFLLAVAMGANLGSVATIVGNPQNMLVASFSHVSYARFAAVQLPVALTGLAVASGVLRLLFRKDLAVVGERVATTETVAVDRRLMVKSLIVTGLLLVALLAGLTPSLCALLAASALLITRRLDPQAVYAEVDWSLLTMFAGLFVVVGGLEKSGVAARWLAAVPPGARSSPLVLVGATTVLSNLVSNVPAVLLLRSWAASFPHAERAWLLLAMASTLAGNLTLVGSVANLIVVEQARGRARIGFWTYLRVGVPLTLVTLALGTAWVLWATR